MIQFPQKSEYKNILSLHSLLSFDLRVEPVKWDNNPDDLVKTKELKHYEDYRSKHLIIVRKVYFERISFIITLPRSFDWCKGGKFLGGRRRYFFKESVIFVKLLENLNLQNKFFSIIYIYTRTYTRLLIEQ